MKMLEYLHSKAVTLCFLLISALSFITFMIVADVKAGYIFIAVFLFIFIVLGWFLTSYFLIAAGLKNYLVLRDHLKINIYSENYCLFPQIF